MLLLLHTVCIGTGTGTKAIFFAAIQENGKERVPLLSTLIRTRIEKAYKFGRETVACISQFVNSLPQSFSFPLLLRLLLFLLLLSRPPTEARASRIGNWGNSGFVWMEAGRITERAFGDGKHVACIRSRTRIRLLQRGLDRLAVDGKKKENWFERKGKYKMNCRIFFWSQNFLLFFSDPLFAHYVDSSSSNKENYNGFFFI